MKRLIYLAMVLAAAISARIAYADEIRACNFAVKAHCVSADARVTLADGTVKRIEVDVVWCGLAGHPGYTCIIDSSRGDADSAWSEDAGAVLITNTAPWNPDEPDRIKMTVGRDVSIDLKQTQSLGRCGAGAALPTTIVIPAQKGACRVQLGSP